MRFRALKPSITCSLAVFIFTAVLAAAGDGESNFEIVNKALEQAETYSKEIVVPEDMNEAAESAAKEAYDRFESREFQESIKAETERIKQTLFGNYSPESGQTETEASVCLDSLQENQKVFLFVSSSMPVSTLRTYAMDLDALNDPNFVMVLRGFVGGMKQVRPTLDFIEKIAVREEDCRISEGKKCDMFRVNIEIDPMVFQKFHIEQVPAIAYAENVQAIDTQQSIGREGNLSGEMDAAVVYGDASIEYALEQIFIETKDPQIQKAMNKLQEGFYDE